MQETKFVDFREEKLKDFLNKHRNCKVEQVIGNELRCYCTR